MEKAQAPDIDGKIKAVIQTTVTPPPATNGPARKRTPRRPAPPTIVIHGGHNVIAQHGAVVHLHQAVPHAHPAAPGGCGT